MSIVATDTAAGGPLGMMRLVLRFNLHPEAGLHPSWLPADWSGAARSRLAGLGPQAQPVLRDVLVRLGVLAGEPDYAFDSPLKRLLLLDPPSLRRLAFYTSLCAHAPLMRPRRGAVSAALRRQARRIDADAAEFALERTPPLSELRMSVHGLEDRPAGCGRLLVDRGYRLLAAVLAGEGAGVERRLARMLPRRAAALPVPALAAQQRDQLRELMLACIVPERLAPWDWLF